MVVFQRKAKERETFQRKKLCERHKSETILRSHPYPHNIEINKDSLKIRKNNSNAREQKKTTAYWMTHSNRLRLHPHLFLVFQNSKTASPVAPFETAIGRTYHEVSITMFKKFQKMNYLHQKESGEEP